MRGASKSFATLCLLAAACGPPAPPAAPPPALAPKNVILLIGDGAGLAYWTAARFAADSLAIESMPTVGLVDTRSSDRYVTDSAAGATAYAAGVRSYNGAIGVGPECLTLLRRDSAGVWNDPDRCAPLPSVFDVARRRGMSVGVVTTTDVTDATPAAFLAHAPRRAMKDRISAQFLAEAPDVILGGGRRFFDSAGIERFCARAACLAAPDELGSYRPDDRPLFGLFAAEGLGYAPERSPTLTVMARAALAKLQRNPRGFMVMIESEGTDEGGHENLPLADLTREVLALDSAVAVALDFARADGNTLVVVTADHETGGFTLMEPNGVLTAVYNTRAHSGTMVPLFAFGPGAERLGGIHDNAEVGRILRRIVSGGDAP